MRGVILLSIAALSCSLVGVSEATTCTANTKKTCKKSLFMTGKCVNGVCQCISSVYTPGPFGCQKKQKQAKITTLSNKEFNGELQTDASVTLQCSLGIGKTTYKWFKNGVEITGQTKRVYRLSDADASMSGTYKCRSNIAGLPTDSVPLQITVRRTFRTKPTVEGMPTAVAAGMKIPLTCAIGTVFKYAGVTPTFQWVIDGKKEPAQLDVYRYTVKAGDARKKIKCSAQNGAFSEEVSFPANIATDIQGVEIISEGPTTVPKGQVSRLVCKLTGGFIESDNDFIRYQWKKDNKNFGRGTRTLITDPQSGGLYTCTAAAGSKPPKTSKAVKMTVKNTMGRSTIVSSSPNGQLKKGYFSLTCHYKTVDTTMPVTYKWFQGEVELLGVTDKVLQFNEVSSTDYDGTYFCEVTSKDGTNLRGSSSRIAFKDLSEISSNSYTPYAQVPRFIGVGETSTFTCKMVHFLTPGMHFTWRVNNVKQTEVSDTLKYTPTSTASLTISCDYTFMGHTSPTSTSPGNPKYIDVVIIKIQGEKVATSRPVKGTKIKLTCDVHKSKGSGRVTYKWKKAQSVLPGETSKYYEIKAGSATLSIGCEATANSETRSSQILTVVPQLTAVAPTVGFEPNYDSRKIGKKFVLKCESASNAEGSTFEWSKDGTVIKGATSLQYTIDKLSQADDGGYSCKIKVGGQTSSASSAYNLKTGDPLQNCKIASDCNGPHTVCIGGECKCMAGYAKTGDECKLSGSMTVMGSLLMIVCAILTQRIL